MQIYQLNNYHIKISERDERSWVYINVPKTIMNLTQSLRNIIDPDDLYKEKGNDQYGLETEPHITVKWGLFTDCEKKVAETVGDSTGGKIELGETSLFEKKDKYDVLKVTCKSKELTAIHKKLSKLENDDGHPTYNIHITLAYLLPGKGEKYAGRTEFVGKTFTFSEVYFENTKDEETKIKLK